MESEIFGISMPMLSPTAVAMEISSSSVDHGVIVPTDTLTGQSQTYYLMGGYPFFSTLQEEAIDSSCAFGNPIPPDHLQESPLLLSSPASSLQALLPYGCCGRLNSSLSASNACAFDAEDDGHSLRWSLEMLQARSMATTGCPSGSDSAWVSGKSSLVSDDPYAYGVPGNELSLTLGSRQQSEMSCSGITSKEKGSRGGGATELPVSSQFLLGGGAPGFVQLSPAVLASPYLHAAHQVLAEVTGCAIEEESKPDDPQYLCSEEFRAHEPKTLKTELIGMLQMIDHGYSECVDRIQNVIASFMSTTSPPPAQTPARFVLRAVSALYKSLRERIVSQMHSLGQQFSGEFMFEPEESLEYSFLHRRWALQQLKNDHQSWRPQRGLPEKSVAVLRSWMFQNFLHPYPKDSEKQLLALKSGLTRSQVSNWFINARVRLWKPMIEEMYQEMSRKARRDEGAGDNQGDGASPGVRSS